MNYFLTPRGGKGRARGHRKWDGPEAEVSFPQEGVTLIPKVDELDKLYGDQHWAATGHGSEPAAGIQIKGPTEKRSETQRAPAAPPSPPAQG